MNLARESVRGKPLGHRVCIQECPINPLRRRAEHSVKSNSVCVVCFHIRFVVWFFLITMNAVDALGHLIAENLRGQVILPALSIRSKASFISVACWTGPGSRRRENCQRLSGDCLAGRQGCEEIGVSSEDLRKYATEQGIAEEERHGGDVEGVCGKGAEVYAKGVRHSREFCDVFL